MDPKPEYFVALMLLETGAVSLRPDKPFHYNSGIISPVYCDNRILLSFPTERGIIKDLFTERMGSGGRITDAICGIATGSIAWAALVADGLGLPMGYARGEAKDHGKKCKVEGRFKVGQTVRILEDLVTTAGSSVAAVNAVRELGCIVPECLSIFSYELPEARKAFEEADCVGTSLTSFSYLIEEAGRLGRISNQQRALLLDWHGDPNGWGRRHGFKKDG